MNANWNSMRAMSLLALVVRFGLAGAFSGLVVWLAVLGLSLLFEVSRTSWVALLPAGWLEAVLAACSGEISPAVMESGSTHARRPGFAPGSCPAPSQAASLPALFGLNQIV